MSQKTDGIAENITHVRECIQSATRAAGRTADDVRLIAVSKRMSADRVAAAVAAGVRCFGENTLQDAATKQALIDNPSLEWHFIGHLQSNKAKAVAENFDWLHTLDSLKLARRLSDHRPTLTEPIRVLLQVNIARDPAKYGLTPDAVPGLAEKLLSANYPGIRLQGLMTIGQHGATDAQRRVEFAALRTLSEDCGERFGDQYFRELSMGMSDDYALAIAEGATMVRVGSAIFGARGPAT